MGLTDLVRRVFLVDLVKGLRLTFSYQRPSATCTEQYPLERPVVAERYRGAPRLNNHPETGETLCIACNLCSLACPENLIVVGWTRIRSIPPRRLQRYSRLHRTQTRSGKGLILVSRRRAIGAATGEIMPVSTPICAVRRSQRRRLRSFAMRLQ